MINAKFEESCAWCIEKIALGGEIKFWKKCVYHPECQRDAYRFEFIVLTKEHVKP